MVIKGYEDRVGAQWQQTRLIVYTVACTVMDKETRPEIYDFMPLRGDPTIQERMEMKERQRKKDQEDIDKLIEEQRKFNDELRREMSEKSS